MPSVLIVRGHLSTPWELRPWLALPERYEVSYLLTRSNLFATPEAREGFNSSLDRFAAYLATL